MLQVIYTSVKKEPLNNEPGLGKFRGENNLITYFETCMELHHFFLTHQTVSNRDPCVVHCEIIDKCLLAI